MLNERDIWRDTAKHQPFYEVENNKGQFLCEVRLQGYDNVIGLKAMYDCKLDLFKPLNYKIDAVVREYKIIG